MLYTLSFFALVSKQVFSRNIPTVHTASVEKMHCLTYLSDAIRILLSDAALALAASLNSGSSGDTVPFNLKFRVMCSDAVHNNAESIDRQLIRVADIYMYIGSIQNQKIDN